MKIEIDANTLCNLLAPQFTFDACKAICELLEDTGEVFHLGDIAISFSELAAEDAEPYEEGEFIELDNGNILVFN